MNVEMTNENKDTKEFSVYKITNENDELLKCRVGEVAIEMLIDSGSTYNLIDDKTWEYMKLNKAVYFSERYDRSKKFMAYGRIPLELLTVFDAVIEVPDEDDVISTTTTFYVIQGGQQALLGKNTARKLGLLRVGLPSSFKEGVNQIKQVDAFPKIKDFQLVLPIDKNVTPVIQPLRRCPVPLLEQVKSKLDELLEMGIIERVEKPSPWVSPLVPAFPKTQLLSNGVLFISGRLKY